MQDKGYRIRLQGERCVTNTGVDDVDVILFHDESFASAAELHTSAENDVDLKHLTVPVVSEAEDLVCIALCLNIFFIFKVMVTQRIHINNHLPIQIITQG